MKNETVNDYYTIDEEGLDSLVYFLKKYYDNKTVYITVIEENEYHKLNK